jgi:hypothetical protein
MLRQLLHRLEINEQQVGPCLFACAVTGSLCSIISLVGCAWDITKPPFPVEEISNDMQRWKGLWEARSGLLEKHALHGVPREVAFVLLDRAPIATAFSADTLMM